jgi:hypothetical protein
VFGGWWAPYSYVNFIICVPDFMTGYVCPFSFTLIHFTGVTYRNISRFLYAWGLDLQKIFLSDCPNTLEEFAPTSRLPIDLRRCSSQCEFGPVYTYGAGSHWHCQAFAADIEGL